MKKTGESLRGILSVLRKSQKISENVFPENIIEAVPLENIIGFWYGDGTMSGLAIEIVYIMFDTIITLYIMIF